MGITTINQGKHVLRWQTGRGRRGRKFTRLTVHGSREKAEEVYASILLGVGRTKPVAPIITLSQFAPQYLSFCADLKEYRNRKNMVALILREFGNHALTAINSRLVEAWQTDMIARGLKPATVNRRIGCLRHMVRKAADWDMAPLAVSDSLRKVKMKREPLNRLRFLTREEADLLLEKCDYWRTAPKTQAPHQVAAHLRPIVGIALNTGMRLGEIFNLRWLDVDMRRGMICVENTKNGERRDIPMNDTARGIFAALAHPIDESKPIFKGISGEKLKRVNRSFATALRRAGIRDAVFHTLRHTFASNLVMAGADLTTVKELLGHNSITMTLRYAHLSPAHKERAVRMLDRPQVREVRDPLNESKP